MTLMMGHLPRKYHQAATPSSSRPAKIKQIAMPGSGWCAPFLATVEHQASQHQARNHGDEGDEAGDGAAWRRVHLQPAREDEHEQHDQKKAHNATGTISPAPAVSPRRERADQDQDEDDDHDEGGAIVRHWVLLPWVTVCLSARK
jgi:hypothetical protein